MAEGFGQPDLENRTTLKSCISRTLIQLAANNAFYQSCLDDPNRVRDSP